MRVSDTPRRVPPEAVEQGRESATAIERATMLYVAVARYYELCVTRDNAHIKLLTP